MTSILEARASSWLPLNLGAPGQLASPGMTGESAEDAVSVGSEDAVIIADALQSRAVNGHFVAQDPDPQLTYANGPAALGPSPFIETVAAPGRVRNPDRRQSRLSLKPGKFEQGVCLVWR